jgi:endonuclease/exonuclease/phosphatase (EEP) superfamily protein YafD
VLLALMAGVLGRYFWVLDLFSHFRAQYAVLLFVCAVALLFRRRRIFAVVVLAAALISAAPLVDYIDMSASDAEAKPRRESFRLVSFNVWFRNDDLRRIASFLESTQADVIVLQELSRAKAAALQPLLVSFPHSYLEDGRRYGTVVFSRWPLIGASVPLSEKGVDAARVSVAWRDEAITVLGVHLHWPLGARHSRLRNADLQGLARYARTQAGPLLIAGDFNITPWSAHFGEVLSASGLNDCAVGRAVAPTWPAQFPPLGISIDHCLASKHWRSLHVQTGPNLGSDHRALVVDLEMPRKTAASLE